METAPEKIFSEYEKATAYKASLGEKGIFEQSRINERFYVGDQWYGANCGNDRPLVRHNVIKRIGDYKMSQITENPVKISFTADDTAFSEKDGVREIKDKIKQNGDFRFKGKVSSEEINALLSALAGHRNVIAKRTGLDELCGNLLRRAFTDGGCLLYTYLKGTSGDIGCEIADNKSICFADPELCDLQSQEYIIAAGNRPVREVLNEAKANGADAGTLKKLEAQASRGKILVLTKFYKEYKDNGASRVMCVKVTENTVVRTPFDTKLSLYPFSQFNWEQRTGCAYGESEITYLIPNQIAINRMITAGVWSAMTSGMPMMVINGDTVTCDITDDPGQIIKVYGSNEDVEGAVRYITPPSSAADFVSATAELISNTLTQSGASAAALGDSNLNNATAISVLQSAANLPLKLIKSRYLSFLEQTALIWLDFIFAHYGFIKLKIEDNSGVWYFPFDSERYKGLSVSAVATPEENNGITREDTASALAELFDKGVISKAQYLKRIPEGLIPDIKELIEKAEEEKENDV